MWREGAKGSHVKGLLLIVGGGGLEVTGLHIMTKLSCEGLFVAVEIRLKSRSVIRVLRSKVNCVHH